ncbi:MAG: stage II sporulation protein M [Bacillota bacterium]|nr:stage II sporulation protein M [Bacillota bacterium]
MNKFYGRLRKYSSEGGFFVFSVFAVMFLVGITAGAFIAARVMPEETNAFMKTVKYSAEHSGDNVWRTVGGSFVSIVGTVLLLWLSGFFYKWISIALSGTAVVCKGAVTGYTVAMLTRAYVWRGALMAVISIFPQYLILLPLMFFMGARAVMFSLKNDFKSAKSAKFKNYIILLVVALFLSLAAALLDGFAAGYLMNRFSVYIS